MSLIEKLDRVYPNWRELHKTPLEAAVEVGLLDEEEIANADVPELDFNED